MPGHWNTVSVMMAKAIIDPSCRPVMVMTGISVLRRAWRKLTARSVRPRARAKRMKSERSTSSISERTRRMMRVTWKSPSMTAGNTSDLRPLQVRRPVVQPPRSTTSPRPKDGNQLSQTEKMSISRMPVTKVGTEIPTSETTCKTWLTAPCRLSPVYTPIGTPTTRAMRAATSTSSRVAGRRSAIRSLTGRLLR